MSARLDRRASGLAQSRSKTRRARTRTGGRARRLGHGPTRKRTDPRCESPKESPSRRRPARLVSRGVADPALAVQPVLRPCSRVPVSLGPHGVRQGESRTLSPRAIGRRPDAARRRGAPQIDVGPSWTGLPIPDRSRTGYPALPATGPVRPDSTSSPHAAGPGSSTQFRGVRGFADSTWTRSEGDLFATIISPGGMTRPRARTELLSKARDTRGDEPRERSLTRRSARNPRAGICSPLKR